MRFDPNGDIPFQLEKLLNSGIGFADNLEGGFVEIETTGEEQEVQHGLGFTPSGFIIILRTDEVELWGTRLQDWDQERLFLQSSATNVTVRLFVM